MTDPQGTNLPGISGQRIAITAGASGIGFTTAKLLHGMGAQIAICDIDPAMLESARHALGDCLAIPADVSDASSVDAFFQSVEDAMGGLDGLVNNAGIAGPTAQIEDISPEDWRRCIDVCLTGQFLCASKAVPLLKAAGGGSLVNMSSAAGKHGYAFRTPYSAAKFGVIGLTQSLAKELGPDNIRVNAILPGFVDGPRMDKVISDRADTAGMSEPEMREDYLSKVSLRRMVQEQDVASAIAFLMSSLGKNLSGQSMAVDGNVETL